MKPIKMLIGRDIEKKNRLKKKIEDKNLANLILISADKFMRY